VYRSMGLNFEVWHTAHAHTAGNMADASVELNE
jgi:hypothetical protein